MYEYPNERHAIAGLRSTASTADLLNRLLGPPASFKILVQASIHAGSDRSSPKKPRYKKWGRTSMLTNRLSPSLQSEFTRNRLVSVCDWRVPCREMTS